MMHAAAFCLCCFTVSATSDALLNSILYDSDLKSGLRLEIHQSTAGSGSCSKIS